MKNNIETISDLHAERVHLKNQLQVKKAGMKNDLTAIKQQLNPVHQAAGFVKDILTRPRKGLLYAGVGLAADILLKRGILRRAGWVTRLVVPFLVTNYASKTIQRNSGSIVESGLKWFKKVTDKPKTFSAH